MQFAADLGPAPPKPVHGHNPTTFLQRGVVVPYTTPALVGARVRPAEREPLELIVPNLSGGRGVYLLPLADAASLCRPTLHDRALNARLAAMAVVTPELIRAAARDVARDGLAGATVAEAAQASLVNERQQGLRAHFEMIIEILRQIEPRGEGWVPPESMSPSLLPARARAAIVSLSVRTRRSGEQMMSMVEHLSDLFCGVGVGRQAETCRVAVLIGMLRELRQELARSAAGWTEDTVAAAEIIDATAELTLAAADATLAAARRELIDLPMLLVRWSNDPEAVGRLASRPDWLLDGWQRICLLWKLADERVDRSAIVMEMLELVPTLPAEVSNWAGIELDERLQSLRHRRHVRLGHDWRTGLMVVDLLERNERLHSLSPFGPV